MLLKIVIIVLGIFLLMISGVLFYISFIFEHRPQKTGKTGGFLQKTKHKKDVTIYIKDDNGTIRTKFFKHLTKGVYKYSVGGKDYKIRDNFFIGTSRQMQKIVPVIYLKKFPRISYIETEIESRWLYGAVLAFLGASLIFIGFVGL